MPILKRAQDELLKLEVECMTELQFNKDSYRKLGGISAGIAALCYSAPLVFANNYNITTFTSKVKTVISDIYNGIYPIFTILCGLMLIIAFIMRMTANQQKAAQATSWIIRIIVCFICVNCIGLIFGIIRGTTASYHKSTASALQS